MKKIHWFILLLSLLLPWAVITAFAEEEEDPVYYTVTFHANGHGTAPAPVQVPAGKSLRDVGRDADFMPIPDEGWIEYSMRPDQAGTQSFWLGDPITQDMDLYYFWSPVTSVGTVSITFTPPRVGQALATRPQVTGQNSAAYRVRGTVFQDENGNSLNFDTGSFVAGKTYYACVEVTATMDYVLVGGLTSAETPRAGNLTVLVNGANHREWAVTPYGEKELMLRIPFVPGETMAVAVGSASASVKLPVAGSEIGSGYAQVTGQQNCTVARAVWLRRSGTSTEPLNSGRGGTFSADEQYGVQLILMPRAGTYFTENTRVQINGGCEIWNKELVSSATAEFAGAIIVEVALPLGTTQKTSQSTPETPQEPDTEAPEEIQPVTYSIKTGANASWDKGSAQGLQVVSDAPFEQFEGVEIDAVPLDTADYDVREGSTVVTIHPGFLESLEPGEHTMTIRSADGEAATSFTVSLAQAAQTEGTEKEQPAHSMSYEKLWLFVGAALLLAAGTAGFFLLRRKKQ